MGKASFGREHLCHPSQQKHGKQRTDDRKLHDPSIFASMFTISHNTETCSYRYAFNSFVLRVYVCSVVCIQIKCLYIHITLEKWQCLLLTQPGIERWCLFIVSHTTTALQWCLCLALCNFARLSQSPIHVFTLRTYYNIVVPTCKHVLQTSSHIFVQDARREKRHIAYYAIRIIWEKKLQNTRQYHRVMLQTSAKK